MIAIMLIVFVPFLGDFLSIKKKKFIDEFNV